MKDRAKVSSDIPPTSFLILIIVLDFIINLKVNNYNIWRNCTIKRRNKKIRSSSSCLENYNSLRTHVGWSSFDLKRASFLFSSRRNTALPISSVSDLTISFTSFCLSSRNSSLDYCLWTVAATSHHLIDNL